MTMAGSGVRFERRGRLGIAILDRPQVLNALTREMVRALSERLVAWRDDPGVTAVLLKAAPGRAFCAGGDIRTIVEQVRAQGPSAALAFFHDEYRLNWRIHTFPKPYLALLDGLTFGGGAGLSIHGGYRVATENTVFAMPETAIGFFPDVGATWFLPRCPGEVGTYLGLSGARLNGADCLHAGLATHVIPAARLGELEERLVARLAAGDAPQVMATTLAELTAEIGTAQLPALQERIDRCYRGDSLAAIGACLAAETSGFGQAQLTALRALSPFALHLTLAQLRRGRHLGIEAALRLEYRIAHRMPEIADFIEGVRAMLVDKDKQPQWRYTDWESVPPDEIEACMAPLPSGDLTFDWEGI